MFNSDVSLGILLPEVVFVLVEGRLQVVLFEVRRYLLDGRATSPVFKIVTFYLKVGALKVYVVVT